MTRSTLLSVLELACLGRVPRGPELRDVPTVDAPPPEERDTYSPDQTFRSSGLRRQRRRAWARAAHLTTEG